MDAVIDIIAQVLLLGSLALLIWGGILTAGQLVRSGRVHRAADDAGRRGAERRGAPRAGLATPRRGRFSRLAPPA